MLQDGNRLYKVAGTSHGSVRKINVRILFSPLLTGSQILESFSNITHWSIECPILLFQANVSPLQMVLGGLSELCTFDQLGQRFAAVQRFFWRTWELLHLIVQVSWMIPLLGQFWSHCCCCCGCCCCCCGLGTFDILWPRPRKRSEKRKRERGPWALRRAWYEMKNRVPLWRGCTLQRLGVRSVIRYSWQISSRIDSSKCELLLHGFAPK